MRPIKCILAIFIFVFVVKPAYAQPTGPNVDIWYGDLQYFGQNGNPQKWINVLGNVSDADGIKTLDYTLNGGSSMPLNIGPDNRRLQNQGDFNIDINLSELLDGTNAVEVTAVDNLDNSTVKSVSLIYQDGNIWETNYAIAWDTVTNIQNVVQVVDGKWNFSSDGIRVVEPGYDRLVAIGDTSWTDYEVVLPITVNSLEAPISPVGGDRYGAGLLMRWTGHTDDPISGWQPKAGWEPLGEIGWFNWNKDTEDNPVVRFWGGQEEVAFGQSIGTTYMMKFRVTELPGEGQLYNIKVWEQGASEPFDWTLSYLAPTFALDHGSFNLIAHHIDVTFGNIDVKPLDINDFPAVSFTSIPDVVNLKNINFNASGSTDPDGSIVSYSWDFGDGNTGSGQTVSHLYSSNGIYEVKLTLNDDDGNQNVLTKDVLVNDYASSTISSDDFNQPALNLDLWSFINPLADGSYNMSGYNTSKASVNLTVPGGESHDITGSGNNAVRIMQPSNDTDLQVEAKFISFLTDQYQAQGILVEQDANNFIRFDFFSDGSDIRAYASTFTNGSPTVKLNSVLPVSDTDTLYLKVSRVSNSWQMDYSIDGIDWVTNTNFVYSLVVNDVGVFGLNAGSSPPSHTTKVDYFFNTASPIDPEDGLSGIPVADFEYVFDNSNPLQINFDASASIDPDGTITSYAWDFGDGNSGTGVSPSHVYSGEGSYDVSLTVTDNDGVDNTLVKEIFVSNAPIRSDDFNSPSLNSTLWTFIDPKDDGTISLVGYNSGNATLQLTVPVGVSHDITVTSNDAVRIVQDATNSDFDLEVKFESSLSEQYQLQGLLIEQDASNYIRFDFFSDGASTRNYAAVFSDGTRTIKTNTVITAGAIAPLFLRVHRSSDNWSMEYSLDSTNWVSTASFSHPMTVNNVGITAGNAGSNPPAFTAMVDYFFNSLVPIIPEDGLSSDPAADFLYAFDNGDPKMFNFDATPSFDTDGTIVSYEWDFGDTNSGSGIQTSHNYAAEGTYSVILTVTDNAANTNSITKEISVSDTPIFSDDFNSPNLKENIWTFVDPRTDGSQSITGYNSGNATLDLQVPSGKTHDVTADANNSVRIMQPTLDKDFDLEIKFESILNQEYQIQGILVEESSSKFIRFDFLSDGANIRHYAASFNSGTSAVKADVALPVNPDDALYMRIHRNGNSWLMEYSVDSLVWNTTATFNYNLIVSNVGVFAGNAGTSPPQFTSKVDYFFNSASPYLPEDEFSGVPSAQFSSTTDIYDAYLVNFDASASYDPDGTISTYSWDFGDGDTGSGQTISHMYSTIGTYTASLTVTDNDNISNTLKQDVVIIDSPLVSDDFNSPTLNTSIWKFVNPLGDGSYAVTGYNTGEANISLVVPSGTSHDVTISSNDAVRIMQGTSNTNFDIETKFTSDLGLQFQSQGIIIQEDQDTYIRADFLSDGTNIRNFIATYDNGSSTTQANVNLSISPGDPMFLRLHRNGNAWDVEYSIDSTNWTSSASFTFTLAVDSVGVFAGNAGGIVPAHTAVIDYFFNQASPIIPEDGNNQKPIPSFMTSVVEGNPLNIQFDASTSEDDELIVSYNWDFGDGNTDTGEIVNHIFATSGDYSVKLVLTDNDAEKDSITNVVVVNINPTALFTATENNSSPYLFDLDASTSGDIDGTITSYQWDFGDGNTDSGITASHAYATAGEYEIILIVTDDDGGTNASNTLVNANEPPAADFTYEEEIFDPYIYNFDASSSIDLDGSIVSFSWDFGDGNAGNGETITHNYTSSGEYEVSLTIADDDGATDQVIQTININIDPVASFSFDVDLVDGKLINFDASASADPDGTISTYSWDFGDGNTATGSTSTHTYALSGIYTVSLTVTDDDDATNLVTEIVDVNMYPKANFTFSLDASNELLINFDASTSSDPDGSIAMYDWEFGDGVDGTGFTTSHLYTISGLYSVNLSVTDDKGAVNTIQISVNVNRDPFASFSYEVDLVNERLINFDATASTDADGIISTYSWDFGDGGTGIGITSDHIYASSGLYTVSLTVTDNDGRTNMVTSIVDINLSPEADFTYSTGPSDELLINFDASMSSDPDGTIVSYDWDFGDGNTGTGKQTAHTFPSSGSFDIRLSVTDDDGGITTIQQIVNINLLPFANFTFSQDANNPFKYDFDASTSSDNDGSIVTFSWNFGDGTVGSAETVSHTYTEKGDFQVSLTVTDDGDGVSTTSSNITIIITAIDPEFNNSNALHLKSYPNPAINNFTQIVYNIPESGSLSISIHDMNGKKVDEFLNSKVKPGEYSRTWEPNGLPKGVYFTRLVFTDDKMNVYSKIIKLVLYK